MGIVVPIFKKGSTSDVNNYIPISLTCISCKIMESVIKDTILCHLLKQQIDIAYLDFTTAFDSVVHSKLLHKLKCYGFNGLLLDWINCFSTNRRQMVRVGSALSHSCNVISGVPQGSVFEAGDVSHLY